MRLPFLILAPACVLVGIATAVWTGARLEPLPVMLAVLGGLAAHVSVNAFNEYFDFRSGLDGKTRRTPFSGGSGTLPELPHMAHYALGTAVVSALATALVGLYFLLLRGWGIVPLGLVGLVVIIAYTTVITRRPLLCLLAPGVGFGTLMVMGTDFALSGNYSWTAVVASMVPFFLVSDLLLINQLPDIQADASIGRKHLPIVLGARASVHVYGLFLLLAYLSIVTGWLAHLLPAGSLLGLATLVLAIPTYLGAYRSAESVPELVPQLGRNVVVVIATPVLMSLGMLLLG
jgi:1,4-dihydroxy-2-naphthoate octaprenyltransferase